MSGLVLHLPRQMYMVSTLTDRLDDAYLVDVEPTNAAAFAVLEFVADEMRRWAVFVTLGDGDRVFVGAAILPSVGDVVAGYALYFL